MQLGSPAQMAPEDTTVSAASATPYWMYACPDGGGAARGSVAAAWPLVAGAAAEESSALAVEASSPATLVSAATVASVTGLFMQPRAYNARPAHVGVDRPMAVRILGWP